MLSGEKDLRVDTWLSWLELRRAPPLVSQVELNINYGLILYSIVLLKRNDLQTSAVTIFRHRLGLSLASLRVNGRGDDEEQDEIGEELGRGTGEVLEAEDEGLEVGDGRWRTGCFRRGVGIVVV